MAKTEAWFYFKSKDAGLSSGIKKYERDIDRFTKRSKRNFSDLGRELTSLNSKLMGFGRNIPGLSALSAGGLMYGGKEAVDKYAKRESTEVAIGFISGKAEEGAKNLEFLKSMTDRMGISYEEAASGFKRFTGSMIGGKYSMEQQRDMFAKISTAIRVMGLDTTATESVYRAFSEMLSKGKMQAQELRTQLANALPGTIPLLAKSMGVTMGTLDKMLQKGAISTEKYMDGFIDALNERYVGGLNKASKKAVAVQTRISNSWDMAMISMGGSIVDAGVLSSVLDVVKGVESWSDANKKLITTDISKAVDWTKNGLGYVKDNWSDIKAGFVGITAGLAGFIATVQGASLVAALSNPMTATAVAVASIAASIGYAHEKTKQIEEYRKRSSLSKELNGESKYMSMGSGTQAALGLKNVLYGSVMFPTKEGQKRFWGGITQLGSGLGQRVLETGAYMHDAPEDSKIRDYIKKSGQFGGMVEEWIHPKDFQNSTIDYGGSTVLQDLGTNNTMTARERITNEAQSISLSNESVEKIVGAMQRASFTVSMPDSVMSNIPNSGIPYKLSGQE